MHFINDMLVVKQENQLSQYVEGFLLDQKIKVCSVASDDNIFLGRFFPIDTSEDNSKLSA